MASLSRSGHARGAEAANVNASCRGPSRDGSGEAASPCGLRYHALASLDDGVGDYRRAYVVEDCHPGGEAAGYCDDAAANHDERVVNRDEVEGT